MMHTLHGFLIFSLLTCLGLNALGSEIINGKNAIDKRMLYMASVQNKEGKHICGGFLISEDLVVTAAHCDPHNPTSVVLGTHNLKKVDDKTMRYTVKRCKNPSYKNISSGNDIMLLKLTKKARLSKRVQLIKLPKPNNKKVLKKCQVAGWGRTSTGGENVDALRVVDVPFIDLDICKREWKSIGVKLPDNVICAGGYNTTKGFCQGDSGGPLVCNGEAVGVVSFNMRKNCDYDYPNIPNIYTDISKYLQLIKDVRNKKTC